MLIFKDFSIKNPRKGDDGGGKWANMGITGEGWPAGARYMLTLGRSSVTPALQAFPSAAGAVQGVRAPGKQPGGLWRVGRIFDSTNAVAEGDLGYRRDSNLLSENGPAGPWTGGFPANCLQFAGKTDEVVAPIRAATGPGAV